MSQPAANTPDSERSGLRKLLGAPHAKAVMGAVGAVCLVLTGVAATYLVAPFQQVEQQAALDENQREQDASHPPITVDGVYGRTRDDTTHGPNVSTDAVLDLDGKVVPKGQANAYDTRSMVPNPVPLAETLYEDGHFITGAMAAVDFTLTGQQHTTVRIRDIKAEVVQREAAPHGTTIFFPPQGNLPNLKLGFDLDSADLSARVLTTGGALSSSDYFRENTVSLTFGEPIGFDSVVVTHACACQFVLNVELSDGRKVRIDQNGKPFFIAAYHADSQRFYSPHDRETPDGRSEFVLVQCASMDACALDAYSTLPK